MRSAWARLAALFRRKKLDGDLDEQIRSHLQMLEDEYVEQGLSRREARDRARREFGGIEQMKESYRDQRSYRLVENIWQDLRIGLRGLRRAPVFTAAAVLSIALGIGANTAIFSLFNTILLSRLPVSHPDDLVLVRKTGGPAYLRGFSYPLFTELRRRTDLYRDLAALAGSSRARIAGSSGTAFAWKAYVSGNFFEMLGVHPAEGRFLTESEARFPGAQHVAVISHELWNGHFGMRRDVVGQSIRIDDELFTIVGVAPLGFRGIDAESRSDVWLPLGCYDKAWITARGANWLRLIARRRAGVPDATVQRVVDALYRQDVTDRLKDNPWRKELLALHVAVEPGAGGFSYLRDQFAGPLQLLLGLTAVLLTIACANVAGLLMARGSARRKEIALRLSIGASRGRIIQQWLTESFLLAIAGGALGVLFAFWAAQVLVGLLPAGESTVPPDVTLDMRVLLFALGAALVSALGFGGLSAWRSLAFDPARGLKDGCSGSRARILSRRVLVVAQVALCFVLLVGAGLFVHTLVGLRLVDPGFRNDGVLTFWLDVPKNYATKDILLLQERLLARLNAMPGVTAASTASMGPFRAGRSTSTMVVFTPQGQRTANIDNQAVSEQYFASLGTAAIRGRMFQAKDAGAGLRAAVVNRSFAREYFGDADPIGGRIGLDPGKPDGGPQAQVIGVVPDIMHFGLRERTGPFVYLLDDNKQLSPFRSFLVRSSLPSGALVDAIRRAARDLDVNAAVTDGVMLRDRVLESLMRESLLALLSTIFGLLAAVLAGVGLYGLMAYIVVQRTNEIGVRIALGATRRDVVGLVIRDALILIAAGLAIGIPGALLTSRVAAAFLYDVKPNDPMTIAGAVALMAIVGALASYLPSRAAASTNPITALRYE